MKIVFFGTSEFALTSLERLIDSKHQVLAVVTQPDRQKGRALKLSPPPTKVLAMTKSIPVYQPQNASSAESAVYLKKLGADLFVVVSFGQILKDNILSIPKLYPINIHGSLLPKYRGAAPTSWTIINGERSSGVTIMKMNERMDEGDIIMKKEIPIDGEDTNITLNERLSDLGAEALIETIGLIESGKTVIFTKQDAKLATYAPKLKKEDGLIDWQGAAINIHNRVRGLLPWPGAYTHFEGKAIKILRTEVLSLASDPKLQPGKVIDIVKGKGILVRTGSEDILITHLQLEGKKAMDADSFVRGHKISGGYILS